MSPSHHPEHPDANDRALWMMLDEERHRERVAERQQRFWLERQAQESTELVDLLGDVARSGRPVHLRTTAGGETTSVLAEVGSDYVGVALDPGATRLIAMRTIVSVRAAAGAAGFGWPCSPRPASLADRLRDAADQQPHLTATRAGESVAGVLRSVGRDVAVLDDRAQGVWYVRLGALDEVVLR